MTGVRGLLAPALVALLLAGAFLLASLASFWLAIHPPRLTIPLSPREYRLAPETVAVVAPDGLSLAGWLLARPGTPAVVLLHGYPAEKADLLPLAAALEPYFTVLLMDLRYFGQSEGGVTTLGLRERGDLRRTIDFLATRGHPRVGVFGLSLGGAVALTTAAEDSRIRAVAAYAPFADLRALGHELYGWLWLLRYPLVELMMLWGRLFVGGDLTRPAPESAARSLTIPVLLIHNRADEQIGFHHAERLRGALRDNAAAEFDFHDRGWHGQVPAHFERRVTDFFRRHLPG
jgi:pimeloyl-ACP methyl ester carboxylesterase